MVTFERPARHSQESAEGDLQRAAKPGHLLEQAALLQAVHDDRRNDWREVERVDRTRVSFVRESFINSVESEGIQRDLHSLMPGAAMLTRESTTWLMASWAAFCDWPSGWPSLSTSAIPSRSSLCAQGDKLRRLVGEI